MKRLSMVALRAARRATSLGAVLALATIVASLPAHGAAQTPTGPAPALASAPRDTSIATIILVRHAEKDTVLVGNDQPLCASGFVRAQELARVVGQAGISEIYVTPWLRNRQTATPIATALRESLTVVDAIDETVRRLRTRHFGETVLVVGHSNTVPEIIEGLTGRPFPTPGHVRYDGMWVVTLGRDGRSTLLTLRYGVPDDLPPERRPPGKAGR
jgi:broad specificity phosphatase PhoE